MSGVGIVGDVMLDHFMFGRADRISPEAPVPVVQLAHEEYRMGGAANVAANVRSFGVAARLTGLIGPDDAGLKLGDLLANALVDSRLVLDPNRSTSEKIRIVTERHQQVARVDRETTTPVSGYGLGELLREIEELNVCSAFIVSDYAKGAITPEVFSAIVRHAEASKAPLLVDPKSPNAETYRGATVITPNHREAEIMAGQRIGTEDGARAACARIHSLMGGSVVMTWGERGIFVFDASGGAPVTAMIPASAREVADVTGAGDTVIGVLAVSLIEGKNLAAAAERANKAAAVAVSRFGTVAVTLKDLL